MRFVVCCVLCLFVVYYLLCGGDGSRCVVRRVLRVVRYVMCGVCSCCALRVRCFACCVLRVACWVLCRVR